jgi:uncharacterized protein (TIGR03083 family)
VTPVAEQLTVSTGVETDGQRALAREALQAQWQRLSGMLRGLPKDAWGQPSRCAEWTVHEVARHLCDTTLKATALLRGASATEVGAVDMDPRTTPLGWMSRSAGETPEATLELFDTASRNLLAALEERGASGPADIEWVYGAVPWSIGALHVFWDAWLHERDILIPLGKHQRSTSAESTAAGVYGLVMASLPILAIGGRFDETIRLTGDGGGAFRLQTDVDPEGARAFSLAGLPATGTITVTVDGSTATAAAGELSGTLEDAVDYLCGRNSEPLVGPPEHIGQLSMLRAFMLTPVP